MMNIDSDYFMIKVDNPASEYKIWVGWSNSGFNSGFYLTNEKQCKFFSSEILEENESIKLYLQSKKYELVPVENIKFSRIYF